MTGKAFFPRLISDAFIHGLRIAFTIIVMCLIAAWASWMRGNGAGNARAAASDLAASDLAVSEISIGEPETAPALALESSDDH